jgi:hypothetical protein|tara:strand:- start:61 stop:270 length:210 start_codon:yes stop_codon:yes gene_type:complete
MSLKMSNYSENNIFDHLKSVLRTQMNEMADHVSGGGCKNFEDYAKCCGIIEGLAVAEREILDLKAKYEE